MGMWRIVLEIAVAMLAAFGLCCIVKTISEWWLTPSALCVAITVYDEETAQNLDVLLAEAERSFMRRGKMRIVVLFSADLMQGCVGYGEILRPDMEALVRRYGADCYVVEPSGGRHE